MGDRHAARARDPVDPERHPGARRAARRHARGGRSLVAADQPHGAAARRRRRRAGTDAPSGADAASDRATVGSDRPPGGAARRSRRGDGADPQPRADPARHRAAPAQHGVGARVGRRAGADDHRPRPADPDDRPAARGAAGGDRADRRPRREGPGQPEAPQRRLSPGSPQTPRWPAPSADRPTMLPRRLLQRPRRGADEAPGDSTVRSGVLVSMPTMKRAFSCMAAAFCASGLITATAVADSPGPLRAAGVKGPFGNERLSDESTLTRFGFPAMRYKVRSGPGRHYRTVDRLRFYTKDQAPENYLVLRSKIGDNGKPWLEIRLPKRPNGSKGWVPGHALGRLRTLTTAFEIAKSQLKARLYKDGREIWMSSVGIGASGTPTPSGRYWVRERLNNLSGNSAYGPFAF